MFESLQDGLTSALKTLRGRGTLTESNMRDGLRLVQNALLEADASFPMVREFMGRVTEQAGAYRPGIVHRLDLETSGVMVIALNEAAHGALSDAFRERKVEKEYHALVFGEPEHDEDRIDVPLGRDLADPTRMAVRFDRGREAQTEVSVLERLGVAAHLLCRPRTGRTHQIRVHLLCRGHPLLGDATYARRRTPPVTVPRLMLHASRLVFPHPESGVPVAVEAPLPVDFGAVLDGLREMG